MPGEDSGWAEGIIHFLRTRFDDILAHAASLLLGVLVLVVGWYLARQLRKYVRRIANSANRVVSQLVPGAEPAESGLASSAAALLGEFAFWLMVLLAIAVAARVAGVSMNADWLSDLVVHIPNLLVGAVLIFVGFIISRFVGQQVAASARAGKLGQHVLIGRLVQGAVFGTAVILGLDQMGMDVTFLVALLAVATGTSFAGLSIAFGLGAQDFVRNMIGARTARRAIAVGQTARIGSFEGEVLEITPTHIVLDCGDGRTLVPARMLDREAVTIRESKPDIEVSDV